ncbi:MAG: V/A-type H+/Na+-transporting ATPase subunit [Halanaerobiales bacterium]|nr:V/A-type H+/Na+-transporting ATPase subunit [Halanaerobiales bacterium]
MAVSRMKKFEIIGHKKDLDLISGEIIESESIQLTGYRDYPLTELPEEFGSLERENPYKELLNRLTSLLKMLDLDFKEIEVAPEEITGIDLEKIEKEIRPIEEKLERITNFRKRLEKEEERLYDYKRHIWLMRNMDLDLAELKQLSYISLIFGRVNRNDYQRLIKNITGLPVLILEVYRDEENVWFFSFSKKEYEEKALNILNSVYFERLELPRRVKGQPRKILERAEHRLERIEIAYQKIELEIRDYRSLYEKRLRTFYHQLKLADKVREISNQYYGEVEHLFVLTGWIPEAREEEFRERLETVYPDLIYLSREVDFAEEEAQPPTFLENKSWVKPFESLVELYGVPRYGELDPSMFMAVTYLLMFGMMFGDVGQGLVFLLAGILILRRIIRFASPEMGLLAMGLGLSSTVFGFLYGSLFGIEDILPALWVRPMENIMYLLAVAVGFGIFLMLASMILSLINSLRRHDLEEGLFSRNGLTGIFLYSFILLSLLSIIIKGGLLVDIRLTVILLVVPLLLIFFRRPLTNLIRRRRIWPESPGEYFLESGFELFDTLIGFLSNTVSFVRIGAFALNHVGLFMAIFILAGMIKNNLGSIFIIIAGNLLIMVLEGVVVGIQVLRLEYYELFSKFFKGDGKKFTPVKL